MPARATVAHDIKAFIRRLQDSLYLIHDVMCYGFLIFRQRPGISGREIPRPTVRRDPASHADAVLGLYQRLRPEVETLDLAKLYQTVELPLVRVLAKMEETGIRVDPDQLLRMSGRME